MDQNDALHTRAPPLLVADPKHTYRLIITHPTSNTQIGLLSAILPYSSLVGISVRTVLYYTPAVQPCGHNWCLHDGLQISNKRFGDSFCKRCVSERVRSWLLDSTLAAHELKQKIHHLSRKSAATSYLIRSRVAALEKETSNLRTSTQIVRKRHRADDRTLSHY